MKNELTCKNERKSKIKERLKQKLEYSEKIKDIEYNKKIKLYNNIKNKELPKIKVLNYIKNNDITEGDNNYNQKININKKYYGLKNKNNNKYKSYNTELNINDSLNNSQNLKGMNLISFNENINNIYKKVTINDYNNKDMDQNVFYNIINVDNICETNEDIEYTKPTKKTPKYSVNLINSYKNDQLLFNFLNQDKIDDTTQNEQISSIRKKKKNDGNRFNFLRAKSNCNIGKKDGIIKKYNTNKNSFRKINIDNNDISKKDNNNIKEIKKKIEYEEDMYFHSKDKNKKTIDNNNDSKSMNNNCKSNNINSEEESSDITIISLCSEDIKDISSDF
jgi:hypothetical protein